MERGDTGLGHGAYGPPGRRRFGDRRASGPHDDAEGAGASGGNGRAGAQDDDYGQLLRRPGEPPRPQWLPQPGRPPMPQPGRPPMPQPGRFASNHAAANGIPQNGGPVQGGQVPVSPLPNGRRVPAGADRPYRQVDGTRARPGPAQGSGAGPDSPGGIRGRPDRPPHDPGTPLPGSLGGQHAYGGAPGVPWVSSIPKLARVPPLGENPGTAGSPGTSDSRPVGPGDWERPGAQAPGGVRAVPTSPEPAGPLIRQRETAVPDEPLGMAQSVASIAPDGLEAFARDLRALRDQADLDYPQMAELSHFTMRTLASAAGGLRLPTLPVAVAYVRACGGNVAEWEERWQKLATKITADAAKKRRSDGDDREAPPEPADMPVIPEPSAVAEAAQDPDPVTREVYVITSAQPRLPGW